MQRTYGSCARPAIGAVLLFGLFLSIGCKKPENELGLDLLDPNDSLGIATVDTTSLVAFTREGDATRTSALTKGTVGSYLDREFGIVRAGYASQMRLSANNVGAGQTGDWVCDSIVMCLAFDPANYGYGNLDRQRFQVFEIAQDLSLDSLYKSQSVPAAIPIDLIEGTRDVVVPHPYTHPVIDGDSLTPQVRIPLKRSLGERFLNVWGQSQLVDNTAFLQFFKGLLVLPANEDLQPWQSAVLYFNLLDAANKVTLYYRDQTPGSEDTLHFDFLLNTSCARFNTVRFDHQAAVDMGLPLSLADPGQGAQHNYVQALGGLRTEVRFPHIMNYAQDRLNAVAKAELVLPLDGPYFALYPPPNELFVYRRGVDGEDLAVPDFLTSAGYIGTTYDPVRREYRFLVTRWMQGVLNGVYPNEGLTFLPGSSGVTVNRAILGGPDNPAARMRLEVTFTTY